MSICYPAFAALSRGRMTIRYLDEWRADVGAVFRPTTCIGACMMHT
jgi:hypothetical protein